MNYLQTGSLFINLPYFHPPFASFKQDSRSFAILYMYFSFSLLFINSSQTIFCVALFDIWLCHKTSRLRTCTSIILFYGVFFLNYNLFMLCIEINRTLNAKPVKPLPIYMVKTLGGGGMWRSILYKWFVIKTIST